MSVMKSLLCMLCWSVALTLVMGRAQTTSAQVASSTSEPHVYLEEPELEPPAPVAASKTIKGTYKNEEKSPRTIRTIVKLADNRVLNDGKYTEFYRNGKKYTEGNYDMGVFAGEWKYWHPNGQLCKAVTFKNGKPDGQWNVFKEEGELKSTKSYRDGRRHGTWVNYHPGGKQPSLEISYEMGKASGPRTSYYENGGKRQIITFKNGLMDGTMTEWDDAGNKRAEAVFKAGKLVGKIKKFDI